MPEFIAAVMPTTRASRRTSSHERVAEDLSCTAAAARASAAAAAAWAPGARLAIDFGLAACHFSMPSRPPSSAGREALALDRRDVDDDRALGVERVAQRAAQRADVVAVDDADVGPVELLPEQARAPRTP